MTAVGLPTVVPSAPPTVEAEGHEPVLMVVEALVGGAEVGAVVAPLELEVGAVVEEPQAASATAANSPPSSDRRVNRWDTGKRPPLGVGV